MKAILFLITCITAPLSAKTITGETATLRGPNGGRELTWNNNLLRFWHSPNSIPEWQFTATSKGSVTLSITYANQDQAGTTCRVSLGNDQHNFTVQDTKSWSQFKTQTVGTFHFNKGSQTLSIDPLSLNTRAVMDLKSITLSGDTHLLKLVTPRTPKRPGVLQKLNAPHPSMQVTDLTPEGLDLRVTGIDYLSDGTMVVSSWDKWGSVYLIRNYRGPREKMTIHRFAQGLAEPLGVCVVDDTIYVQQKQELTRLRDTNNDGTCDAYEVVCNAWDVSGNFHEFAFCPIYKDGYFYVALAIAVNKGGATTNPQQKDRGTLIKINPKTGTYEVLAAGFRTPNGLALSANKKHFFLTDNQGDYLPASKLIDVRPGRFYNHKYSPPHPMSSLPVSPPVAWLPQNEIGNSPTQPLELTHGPYAGQLIFGDIHHGGLKRVSLQSINGEIQGTVFRFAQNLRGGINRLSLTPDGNLIAGIAGDRGNWGNGQRNGLLRIAFSPTTTFEIHSVQTLTNGLKLTFTQPLAEGLGWDPAFYQIDSYTYKPTIKYGGPKIDRHNLTVTAATVSNDRKHVFLEIPNIKTGYVVHGILFPDLIDSNTQKAWAAEWWTTVNHIPTNQFGKTLAPPKNPTRIIPNKKATITPHTLAKTLFAENCQSCHKTSTEKLVGPGLAGLIGKSQKVIRNGAETTITIDKAYLRRAITHPSHEFPTGYQPIMPALGQNFTDKQLDALVDWMSSLTPNQE
ncbi:DUF7133 domain-containing protein [Rubritalea tangerina]|uniref:C-type cytochrome n=1 Tax=Rubritalea tangerina TaxID=430798 RepID=A0ABW4ZEH3_9BACT